jgi:hypothetical protein
MVPLCDRSWAHSRPIGRVVADAKARARPSISRMAKDVIMREIRQPWPEPTLEHWQRPTAFVSYSRSALYRAASSEMLEFKGDVPPARMCLRISSCASKACNVCAVKLQLVYVAGRR